MKKTKPINPLLIPHMTPAAIATFVVDQISYLGKVTMITNEYGDGGCDMEIQIDGLKGVSIQVGRGYYVAHCDIMKGGEYVGRSNVDGKGDVFRDIVEAREIAAEKSDLYSPDAANATTGVYKESQTPSVSWIQDENGRRLYVTDHDVYVVESEMDSSPFNGPSFVTPAELIETHKWICSEVIPPDYSEEDDDDDRQESRRG
jgi:hypothetical protein